MKEHSSDEEARKRAIFEGMSERRKRKILEKGYEKWDPFQAPKDPIDLRMDKNRQTAAMLIRKFLASRGDEEYSRAFSQGAWELCVGIFEGKDRYVGMFEFARWYNELLKGEDPRDDGERP